MLEKTVLKKHKLENQRAANLMPDDEVSVAILKKRAAILAQKTSKNLDARELTRFVHFKLGENEHYGIPYEFIQEIMPGMNITPVPHMPPYIAGVINKQGLLMTVLALNKYFNLSNSQEINDAFIIVINVNHTVLGILVTDIVNSDSFAADELTIALSASVNKIKENYILGLHQGRIAIINCKEIVAAISTEIPKRREL